LSSNKKVLDFLSGTRIDGSKIGDFVKNITFISSSTDKKLQETQFHSLLNHLQHLERFTLGHHLDHYIDYLIHAPHMLPNLQTLNLPVYEPLNIKCFNVRLLFRETITELDLNQSLAKTDFKPYYPYSENSRASVFSQVYTSRKKCVFLAS
jgi:hypothetical protein